MGARLRLTPMSKRLLIKQPKTPTAKRLLLAGSKRASNQRSPNKKPHPLVGKMVAFGEGQRGKVSSVLDGDTCVVDLAIPDRNGLLIVTDNQVIADEVKEINAQVSRTLKARAFDTQVPFSTSEKALEIKDADGAYIKDYRNVEISGLASTFKGTTAADRDGDYVEDGAFDNTLQDFLRNPVMLADHRNSVYSLAGSFTKVGTTNTGLLVEGRLSNAPDVQSIRFKVMEGHLRAFSIGGIFLYGADGRAIEEVILFEISLVAIPANQDSLFFVRSLDAVDCTKCFSHYREKVWK